MFLTPPIGTQSVNGSNISSRAESTLHARHGGARTSIRPDSDEQNRGVPDYYPAQKDNGNGHNRARSRGSCHLAPWQEHSEVDP